MKDCGTHYEYIATWVDDLLIASKNPSIIIEQIEDIYKLKGVGIPEYYLGADIEEVRVDGKKYIATSAKTYIKRTLERIIELNEWQLRNYNSPADPDYHPELDITPFLNEDQHSKFRMMIGCLNWMVTLGRFDLLQVTMTLSRYSQFPRQGHMNALKRVFGYLQSHTRRRLIYDTTKPDLSKH